MAIKIENLELISKDLELRPYNFQDLHLDFQKSSYFDTILGQQVEGNDIKVDYDEQAIKNSLKNLFSTRPGQRFLFPQYGLSLFSYLFEQITELNGQTLGERIVTAIETYEPRVQVQRCDVIPKPDDNEYEINLILLIPLFNTVTSINTALDTRTQSFVFIEAPRQSI